MDFTLLCSKDLLLVQYSCFLANAVNRVIQKFLVPVVALCLPNSNIFVHVIPGKLRFCLTDHESIIKFSKILLNMAFLNSGNVFTVRTNNTTPFNRIFRSISTFAYF